MAQTFHCKMTIDGKRIVGSSSVLSSGGVDRTDGFEGHYFEYVGERPMGGESTGRRHWKPIRIRKVLDKATPMLVHAFVTSKRVDSFECIFFRSAPAGGAAQHHFTVKGTNGRIRSHRISSDSLSEGDASTRPFEEVELVAEKVETVGLPSSPTDW